MPAGQDKLVVGGIVAAIVLMMGYQLLRLARPSGLLPIVIVLVVITALALAAVVAD